MNRTQKDTSTATMPLLTELRDGVFPDPSSLINWLTSKGIPAENIREVEPGVLQLLHDGKPYSFANSRSFTTVRFEERYQGWQFTRWGTGDLDALRGPLGRELDQISGVIRPSTLSMAANKNSALNLKLKIASGIAKQQGWNFGDDALNELDALKDRLSHSLRDPNTPRPELSAGALLEAFLLSNVKIPRPLEYASTPQGALGVFEGMDCLRDEGRTKIFLEGICDAVHELEKRKERIEVIDAGCGAVPILGLYAALLSSKVHVTALELNPDSAAFAQAVVEKFGLQKRIHVVEADACRFTPGQNTDLLISETIAAALTAESLVDVMQNQSKHLAPDGIMIPSAITIRGGLVTVEQFTSPTAEVEVANVAVPRYSPDWKGSMLYNSGDPLTHIELVIPTTGVPPGVYFPVVCSEIHINSRTLCAWDSLITHPVLVQDLNSREAMLINLEDGQLRPTVKIKYPVGKLPLGEVSKG